MMNHLHRLVKPILSSSSSFGVVRSLTRGVLKQYHSTLPAAAASLNEDDFKPFSIINDNLIVSTNHNYSWMNRNASCQILGPGMILLKNYVTLLGAVDIVNMCDKLGAVRGGFHMPRNEHGHQLRLHMMCLGRNWDPVTGYNNTCRNDGTSPPPLPYEFVHLAKTALEDAQPHLDDLPSMCPDTCVVNFFNLLGRLCLHQDCDESSDSLSMGLPVVSISLGNSAEFWYGDTKDENKLRKVLLESGDVLIFGGTSRLIYHGVKRILSATTSDPLIHATGILPGHLSLVLKQF